MTALRVRPSAPLDPGPTVDRILAVHRRLERLAAESALEPDEPTGEAFAELVGLCTHRSGPDAAAVLADPRVSALTGRLRELCADGEFRLERRWARRVLAATDARQELEAFPYLDNYRALAALEGHTLAAVRTAGPRRLCVLGSGPLPLTALLLARELGVQTDAVDLDAEATVLATAVLRRLPGGGLVSPQQGDARRADVVGAADVVVLAALVGLDPVSKRAVVAAVADRMRPGALLLARGARRLRTLLYPPLDIDDLTAAGDGRLAPQAEVHPATDVVNSFVIAVRT